MAVKVSRPETRVSRLDNNVLVVTNSRNTKSAYTSVEIGRGSRHDPWSIPGLNHFIEHWLYLGTRDRTRYKLASAVEGRGGVFNANTYLEQISHYVHGRPGAVKYNMEALADMLKHPHSDARAVRREIEKVLEEIRECNDAPEGYIMDLLYRHAYRRQKIGKFARGSEAALEKITPKLLIKHAREALVGNNIVVIGVGKSINHQELCSLAEQYFGDLPSGTRQRPGMAEMRDGILGQESGLKQTHVAIGLPAPPESSDDSYPTRYLSTILGGSECFTSRLYRKASDKGVVYSPNTNHHAYSDTGMLFIEASTEPSRIRELIRIVGTEVCTLPNNITDTEFNRARNRVVGELCITYDDIPEWAQWLGTRALMMGPKTTCEEIQNRLSFDHEKSRCENVRKEEVHAVAEQICPRRPTMALIGLKEDHGVHYGEALENFGHKGPHEVVHRQRKDGFFTQQLAA